MLLKQTRERLAELRARIAHLESPRPRSEPRPSTPAAKSPPFRYIEEWLSGQEVETAFGRHFETEKLYEAHRHHGSADIGALADLPHDLLDAVSGGAIPVARPEHWAFLDTETTGLAEGACAFLAGVGRITPEGFRVRQFFMRDPSEEISLLDALARHLAGFEVLITYNGRAFDQPLLETRYRVHRLRQPFAKLKHLDLLHGARRLWKWRFERCRLVDLEHQVLGFERQGDLPGALIPYVYFEYLRTRAALRMLPVFQHNATDILTLACFTALVPRAFQDPVHAPFRHGSEMAGIARWLREAGDLASARSLYGRAIEAGLPDPLLFRALWETAALDWKLGAEAAALAQWRDLASSPNPYQARAFEELAKHHEHRLKDRVQALEYTRAAKAIDPSPGLLKREARLLRSTTKTRRVR